MSEHKHTKAARAHLSRMGYRAGGHIKAHSDVAEDKALIKKEVKPSALRLKDGGVAEGGKPKHRADHKGRGKGKGGKSHVTVNVINAHGDKPKPMPIPVPVPAGAGAGGPPPGMPPGGPMGGPPMPPPDGSGGPPGGFKRGGRTKAMKMDSQRNDKASMPDNHFRKGGKAKAYPIKDGAGGAAGRLEKAKKYGA